MLKKHNQYKKSHFTTFKVSTNDPDILRVRHNNNFSKKGESAEWKMKFPFFSFLTLWLF